MTMDNPFPSQMPPPQRVPKPHLHLSPCFDDCAQFSVFSLVTLAFLTFDLATDWLLWKLLSSLWTREELPWQHGDLSKSNFLETLPRLFLYFVALGTLAYVLQLIYICTKFRTQRIKYKSKIDGLAPKASMFGKCSNDLIISVHILVEDLPLAAILLYLQLNVNCDFYIALPWERAFVLYVSATTCCVFWRFVQTIWNWGCFGSREYYHSELLVNSIRGFNLVVMVTILCLLILNGLLALSGHKSSIFSKLALDSWTEEEHVYVSMTTDTYLPVENNDTIRNISVLFRHDHTIYAKPINVMKLKDTFSNHELTIMFNEGSNTNTTWIQSLALLNANNSNQGNSDNTCSIFVSFMTFSKIHDINYNLGYRCPGDNTNKCETQPLVPMVTNEFRDNLTTTTLDLGGQDEVLDSNRPLADSLPYYLYSRKSPKEDIPRVIRIVRPHVAITGGDNICGRVHLIRNLSLPTTNDRCADSM